MVGLRFAVLDRIHQQRVLQDPREYFRSFLSTSILRCTSCSKWFIEHQLHWGFAS